MTGYNFSRYVNPKLPRPNSGITQNYFGAGGTGARVSIGLNSTLWPNAGIDERSSVPGVVTVGQTVNIPFWYADWAVHETVTISLDNDTNPFNGIEHDIGSINENAVSPGIIGATSFPWTPVASDVGNHFIRIQAADSGGRLRYDYFLRPIVVQAAPITAPVITSVSPATLASSSLPQLVTIGGSNFLPSGDPSASTLVFYDPGNNPHPGTPFNVTATSMQYNVNVQSTTGTWKVKVVKATMEFYEERESDLLS